MEKKNNPTLKLQSLKLNESVELKLKTSRPYVSGTSKYGEWNLWGAEVKNFTVYEGRGSEEREIKNYSGEIVFFPSENVHNDIISLVGEEEGVTITVTKSVGENKKGVYTKYITEKSGNGSSPLSPLETELMESVRDLIESGSVENITEEQFFEGSLSAPYNLSKERALELFKTL